MKFTETHAFYLTDHDLEIELEVNGSGSISPYRAATQWEPEEGGESEWDALEIDTGPIDNLIMDLLEIKYRMYRDPYDYIDSDRLDEWLRDAYEQNRE